MTEIVSASARDTYSAPANPSPAAAPGTTSSLSGAVPAQHPARPYPPAAITTATPTPPPPAGASAPVQNAKPATGSPVNGTASAMAQGGPQAASSMTNGTSGHDHGRKPSVVISASGASGYIPNGGPVNQGGRPPINFGSINSQSSPMPPAGVPHQSHPSSLPAPPVNPRVVSPAHSPSPIPQPPASGGRPPAGLQNQGNGVTFGSMGGESQQMPPNQMQAGPMAPGMPIHERRPSSQSILPPGGRGRGYTPQQPYGMASPGPGYRQLPNQARTPSHNMGPQFQQQMPPASPYNRGRNSPAVNHPQPNVSQQHMGGNPQMQYGGYPAHMASQHQGMYNMPHYDPATGYYQAYYPPYGQFPGQAPPQSPNRYPTPFGGQQAQIQPPFHPQPMSRSTSQASERPPSSMGQPTTPSIQPTHIPSQTPVNQPGPAPQSASFVKPSQKKSAAIKITDAQGNPLNFQKASPTPSAQSQPSAPVIVSTPNAPTPPPRVPSGQHNRVESKSTKSAEDTRSAFLEQVRRKQEEEKRKEEEEASKAKQQQQEEDEDTAAAETVEAPEPTQAAVAEPAEAKVDEPVKAATATAEKAAAADAGDEEGEKAADAATSAIDKDDGEKTQREETEDERIEREIAEIEAKEREEEERQKAYDEKKQKQKEEQAKKDAEAAAKQDEELKRQEREAEEREEQREREREAESSTQEPDAESKDLFASLKKPSLGPGASATDSGADTPPASEEAESSSMPPPAQPSQQAKSTAAQKPKPAHLKLETAKRVEPAEPTPGMQALKSARFLELKEEPQYPEGIKSPNPALNPNGTRKARTYNKEFLLQFQNIFKEKPSMDWDQKVKETLGPGDEPASSRSSSSRTPSSNVGRSASGRPSAPAPHFSGSMGNFSGPMGRTLPPGTTSQDRFGASMSGMRPGAGPIPGAMGRAPSQIGMGAPGVGMSRNNSLQPMGNMGAPNSPRVQSNRRGGGGSRRGDRNMSKKEEAELASKMPLTAHLEIAPLEKSTSGWKPTSIGQPMGSGPDLSGNMAPDLVQRKVKAALNKMTPEKFDKISDQILEIAAQSKNESDGRTLRQVIQLTFEKACDEAHWAGMYAQFCHRMLTTMSSDIRDETIKDKAGNPVVGGALFRKYLLNRCQEEFERGWQVNLPEKPDGESQEAVLLSDEYYTAAAAKRRGLGLIQFIGQLYRLKMLTLRIMHECVLKLLNFEGDPDEAAVENLTTLLRAVGATMDEDEQQGRQMLEAYFQRIDQVLLKSDKLGSRPKFMVMDLVDLRKAGWKGKDDAKGPKTIQQIHAEAEAAQAKAEAERQRQSQRGPPGGRPPAGRGDARNFSGGMQPPVDYTRTTVGMDDLRKLQARNSSARQGGGGGLGPGGSLGPASMLGARSGSRRGAGASNLGPSSSGNTTRTNTPPVDPKDRKDEQPSSQQNAFSALASLDPSGEGQEDAPAQSESPPATRSKSPLASAAGADPSSSSNNA